MSKKDDLSTRLSELSVSLGREIEPGSAVAEIEAQIAAAEAELERRNQESSGDTGDNTDGNTGGDADGDADGDAGAELQIMKEQVQVNPLATFSTKFQGETYLFNKGRTSGKIPFELAYSLEKIKKVKVLG